LPDVRDLLNAQNANLPKGQVSDDATTSNILANDQLLEAKDYRSLIVGYHKGAAIKLSDVAQVTDSVENLRISGYVNRKNAIPMMIFRQPGANIIDTVDRVRQALPSLKAAIPPGIDLAILLDRTVTIRSSVRDVERALIVSVCLVILVVFFFLRSPRATVIPAVVVPVSLIGTFGAMYLFGYSLDNLSLMALTISTGFVVDDAIVVIENITRYMEQGMRPLYAALRGASEIGFTVLSISLSLVSVFIPILLMGGIIGRLFREFAVTLSVSILVSLVVSLTTTPMMCSRLLKHEDPTAHGRIYRASEEILNWLLRSYERALRAVLRHPAFTLAILFITIAVNIYLLVIVPKGFFPEQDNGTVVGGIQGSQDASFQLMQSLTQRYSEILNSDPAISNVTAFTGGLGPINSGNVFLALKGRKFRDVSASELIARLRPKLLAVQGARVFMQAGQDLHIGGRASNAEYQYTIQSENLDDLVKWGPILLDRMRRLHGLTEVNSDQQNNGLRVAVVYDRATAARLGITPQALDSTLYDAFGQAQVSTMYTALNQYHVVMEVAPEFWQDPSALKDIYIHSSNGGVVPLSAIAKYEPTIAPLAVNHQGQFPAVTISFNLAPGVALSDASREIDEMEQSMGMPASIHGLYSGALEAFRASLSTEPALIITALLAVYIVLGALYESFIHPITILSTIPSAGVGAVLALLLFRIDLSVIAIIGMILLIGIVKKNAILMIDFALSVERNEGKSPTEAIFQACILRFRPILMTTMAALLGSLPLCLGTGSGSELRRPLGITIAGGLIFSQMLTLFTTPVVYLYMDRLSLWWHRVHGGRMRPAAQPSD
jgi:multidrug efflux pump